VNTGVLLRMVRILSVLMWRLNKGLRLVGKTALFDVDSYTIKRTCCTVNMSTICLLILFYVNYIHILLVFY
jgi:hypothetical protein